MGGVAAICWADEWLTNAKPISTKNAIFKKRGLRDSPLERGVENVDILFMLIVRNRNQVRVYARSAF